MHKTLKSDLFAIIDLGSNSFHLVLYKATGTRRLVIGKHREMIQLAAGLTAEKSLTKDTEQKAFRCLEKFSALIKGIPDTNIRSVGTKTLREIRSGTFLETCSRILGKTIDIVSGHEEARLVYLGVRDSYNLVDKQLLTIDVGGASTEFALGKQARPEFSESLNIGCVTYAKRYGLNNPDSISSQAMRTVALDVRQSVLKLSYRLDGANWETVYGCSGTIKAIARLIGGGQDIAEITTQEMDVLFTRACAGDPLHEALDTSNRANVIYSGIAIVKGIFDALSLSALHVSDANLKEGLLFEMISGGSNTDQADESVRLLASKHRADIAQMKRVATLSHQFWEHLGPLHSSLAAMGIDASRLLEWSAQLHEIGLDLAFKHYHKHSFYIVRHSNLAGLNRMQQRTLSALLLAQRKNPAALAKVLNDSSVIAALYPLLLCLRLAIALNRGRSDTLEPKIRLEYLSGSHATQTHLSINIDETDELVKSTLSREVRYWSNVSELILH